MLGNPLQKRQARIVPRTIRHERPMQHRSVTRADRNMKPSGTGMSERRMSDGENWTNGSGN